MKTWTLMALIVMVLCGRPFLGRKTEQRGVVYGFLEDGYRRAGRRFKMLGASDDPPRDLKVIDNKAELDALLTHMDLFGSVAMLVIIDTLTNYEVGKVVDENAAIEMERLLARLRGIAQRTGTTFIILHHFRKDGLSMRGTVALEASSDGWIEVRRHGSVLVADVTLRDAEDERFAFEVKFDAERVSVVPAPLPGNTDSARGTSTEAVLEKVRAVFRESDAEVGLSRKKVVERSGLSNPQVQGALEALEEAGELDRPKGPKKGYFVTPKLKPAPRAVTREELFASLTGDAVAKNGSTSTFTLPVESERPPDERMT